MANIFLDADHCVPETLDMNDGLKKKSQINRRRRLRGNRKKPAPTSTTIVPPHGQRFPG
jgi:hypothetical protein